MSSMIIVVCYRASVDSLGLGVPYGVYIGNGFKFKKSWSKRKALPCGRAKPYSGRTSATQLAKCSATRSP